MPDNGLDQMKIPVCAGFTICQNAFGVKDIQALIFHRAHIEEINRHYHVNVQIVFQLEALLIPLHGALKRGHGMRSFG